MHSNWPPLWSNCPSMGLVFRLHRDHQLIQTLSSEFVENLPATGHLRLIWGVEMSKTLWLMHFGV